MRFTKFVDCLDSGGRNWVLQGAEDMAELEVKTGPAAGKIYDIEKSVTLGRSGEADIRLDDVALSRKHARILRDDRNRYILQDLRSHNGTFVNRKRVKRTELSNGDEIRAGKTAFLFKRDAASAAYDVAEKTQLDVFGSNDSTTVIDTFAVDTMGQEGASAASASTTVSGTQYENLRTLMQMFSSAGIELSERELLQKILDTLFEVFPDTDRGFIILREPETGKLTPAAVRGLGEDGERRLSISRALLQYVLDKKQTVLSTDAMQDGRFEGSETIMDLQVRSVMCAPLKHEDEVLGFISLDTRKVSQSYNKESLGMLSAIANFASLTIANARLHRDLVAQERVQQDLRNAQRIQHSFLPQSTPLVEGYEFADLYNAAQEVGGDFYDFVELGDGRLGVAVGDVSGKGIPAALLMARLIGNLRSLGAAGLSPTELMKALNGSLMESDTDLFVTILFVAVNCDDHTLSIVNAGHCPPMVRRADGRVEQAPCGGGFPAGVLEEAEYEESKLELAPEDKLCLFTDGIIEAMNEEKEPYGEKRLSRALREASARAQSILERVQDSVWQYVGDAQQHDDITFVCFGPTQ